MEVISYTRLTSSQIHPTYRCSVPTHGLGHGNAGIGSPVVYGCPLSKWEMITPTYQGIGFKTCEAHKIDPLVIDSLDRLTQ